MIAPPNISFLPRPIFFIIAFLVLRVHKTSDKKYRYTSFQLFKSAKNAWNLTKKKQTLSLNNYHDLTELGEDAASGPMRRLAAISSMGSLPPRSGYRLPLSLWYKRLSNDMVIWTTRIHCRTIFSLGGGLSRG
jgi:hypothetical protein